MLQIWLLPSDKKAIKNSARESSFSFTPVTGIIAAKRGLTDERTMDIYQYRIARNWCRRYPCKLDFGHQPTMTTQYREISVVEAVVVHDDQDLVFVQDLIPHCVHTFGHEVATWIN